MSFRVYADEAGTHGDQWLIIGMLFVPDHGTLHSELCAVKEAAQYFNTSPKIRARFKETHLAQFRPQRDVDVAKAWIDLFFKSTAFYRAVVVDWQLWDGSYFGTPFEPEALQKRRAYKKWAEMLLHPELKNPTLGAPVHHAKFYLDRLRILYGYDVIDHLRDRFTRNYFGQAPHIDQFQYTDSARDANQCLQLCDLLTGGVYQSLVPAKSPEKTAVREYLAAKLAPLGVSRMAPQFWRQYAPQTLRKHHPKFSLWFWRPQK